MGEKENGGASALRESPTKSSAGITEPDFDLNADEQLNDPDDDEADERSTVKSSKSNSSERTTVKSGKSNSSDRIGDTLDDGPAGAAINTSHSNIKNL